jgi:hypothetical protein
MQHRGSMLATDEAIVIQAAQRRLSECLSPRRLTMLPPIDSIGSSFRAQQNRYSLLFVKILIRCIVKSGNAALAQQTKQVVALVVQRNRQQDVRFMPLPQVLQTLLRELVGESYWQQAEFRTQYYCCRINHKTITSMSLAERTRLQQRQDQEQLNDRVFYASLVREWRQKQQQQQHLTDRTNSESLISNGGVERWITSLLSSSVVVTSSVNEQGQT